MNRDAKSPEWLLYILTDSALPTGGFVASAGLEAAVQTGHVSNSSESLLAYMHASTETFAYTTTGVVRAAWQAVHNHPEVSWTHLLDKAHTIDDTFEAMVASNHVAKRASLAQGIALLTLYSRCFGDNQSVYDELVFQYKARIHREEALGHYPVVFGFICACLGIDLDKTLHTWLYTYTRTLLSSAVRLNVVGPYQAHRLLFKAQEDIERIHQRTKDMSIDDCCQTNPLLDVVQGVHDRLYTRLFNS